jgi:hypothetical protein
VVRREKRDDRFPDPGVDDAFVEEDERRAFARDVVPEVGHADER